MSLCLGVGSDLTGTTSRYHLLELISVRALVTGDGGLLSTTLWILRLLDPQGRELAANCPGVRGGLC